MHRGVSGVWTCKCTVLFVGLSAKVNQRVLEQQFFPKVAMVLMNSATVKQTLATGHNATMLFLLVPGPARNRPSWRGLRTRKY
jgi:hypothetical protein